MVKGIRLGGAPARLRIAFADGAARCEVQTERAVGAGDMREAHAAAVRMLGLASEPAAFERHVARRPELARLVGRRRGLRLPQTADAWECLVWTIVGQQVNLPFAFALRGVVAELAGEPAGDGLRAHPTPDAVARLDYADLTTRRFSRRKAEYVIDTARLIASGALKIDGGEREMAPALERRLLDVRGLGPWSVQYLLMRGYGFADCVPAGDAGLSAALQRFFALDHRPGPAETRERMEPFAPFRSLATYHLWTSLGDPQ
jgi:AraC family transcriptional regulator of adaptative response / DNA-3-methyladenine glycosylase II